MFIHLKGQKYMHAYKQSLQRAFKKLQKNAGSNIFEPA